ncbi:patatin-like phospholipase family protein [uncultured Winogradskyella sp.]|uniref:patatin-like phospholipase family protein n=1 Tax=uncultured Winogradskyella sp. TaxID=395353 RepID=UPI0026162620|nr:patatin-like phospholipase family protein [uncultured Winogradskyella sp.]
MSQEKKIEPFKKIGLCFSGGGFRATFYALGIVSYLNEVQYKGKPLLESVKALSTVSGGTLLGVAFAKAMQQDGYNFKNFYHTFYETFKPGNNKLLETAIAKLEDDKVWKDNPYKKRSLINAFALTYAEMPVFNGNFEHFENGKIKQLEQVCFNATDFSFGLTYRFQNRGYFGNTPLYKNYQKQVNALRNKVELGDVVASSSCFPVGFEPLVFPDDYFKDQNTSEYKNLKGLDVFIDGVGIMDGGIADNQGIGSMMLISERMDDGLDLIMVNDVGSYKMKPWQQDNTKIGKSSTVKKVINKVLQYFTIKPLYWLTLLAGLLIIILNNLSVFGNAFTSLYIVGSVILGVGITFTVLGLIASVIKGFTLSRLKSIFKKNIPEPLLDDILTFQKLDIDLVKRMLSDRITSASTMINDVFLKQMRRLNYDLFYSKPELKHRRVTTTIYKLNGQETPYSNGTPKYNDAIKPKPSKVLQSVALTASEMPTTLWWDAHDVAKNRMDALIACGQFTACYELMDYILKLKADNDSVGDDLTEINKLYDALEKDWKAFNKNPLWLV